jgi:DNA mismatch repair protein MutS2
MVMKLQGRTLEYLGWQRILDRLEHHVRTSLAAPRVRQLPFLDELGDVRRELDRVDELKQLIAVGDTPEFAGISDIDELVARARKEGVLAPQELLQVGDCLHALARLQGFLSSHRHQLDENRYLMVRFHDLRSLAGRIDSSIERDGRIKDTASAVLHDLRTRAAALHQSLRERMEEFLKSRRADDLLQEKYFTIREDRYVLPVKAQRQSSLDGIVHGVSQTGQTVFVEPQFMISANNRLKLIQEEVRREEYLILSELSDEVAENSERIAESLEMAVLLDLCCARARLALEMKAHPPALGEGDRIELLRARSPHLLLQGKEVVANDIILGREGRLMVLSGPNAGGKSVALKTAGLCLLMARAGLHIPAAPDSSVPVLAGLHALPGDLEDVDADLSTFTGHLQALNRTLDQVGPGHFVLIDEITVGTEPDQGSALGAAFLLALADSGTLGIVATHYERLKALAMGDARFVNGSMGMDWESLEPTYRLAVGSPGSSRTFEIARRFLVSEAVIVRAQEILQGKGGGLLEEALRTLNERERELEAAAQRHREREEEAEGLKRRRELALAQLQKHADRITARKVSKAMEDVQEALALVSFMVAQLQQSKPDHKDLDMKRKTLREIQERLKAKAQNLEDEEAARELVGDAATGDFQVGGEVLVKKYRKKATVVQLHEKEGAASLQMGPMRLRMAFDELVPLAADGQPKREPTRRIKAETPAISEQRVDLRGLSSDEALTHVERALDQAMFTAGAILCLVHGHGTGRLKESVRNYLKACSYPIEFRPGKREEGGDGVTMVEFV